MHQDLSVSLSSDVAPEIREYLRASTTVANAYIRPLAELYLERLEQARTPETRQRRLEQMVERLAEMAAARSGRKLRRERQ